MKNKPKNDSPCTDEKILRLLKDEAKFIQIECDDETEKGETLLYLEENLSSDKSNIVIKQNLPKVYDNDDGFKEKMVDKWVSQLDTSLLNKYGAKVLKIFAKGTLRVFAAWINNKTGSIVSIGKEFDFGEETLDEKIEDVSRIIKSSKCEKDRVIFLINYMDDTNSDKFLEVLKLIQKFFSLCEKINVDTKCIILCAKNYDLSKLIEGKVKSISEYEITSKKTKLTSKQLCQVIEDCLGINVTNELVTRIILTSFNECETKDWVCDLRTVYNNSAGFINIKDLLIVQALKIRNQDLYNKIKNQNNIDAAYNLLEEINCCNEEEKLLKMLFKTEDRNKEDFDRRNFEIKQLFDYGINSPEFFKNYFDVKKVLETSTNNDLIQNKWNNLKDDHADDLISEEDNFMDILRINKMIERYRTLFDDETRQRLIEYLMKSNEKLGGANDAVLDDKYYTKPLFIVSQSMSVDALVKLFNEKISDNVESSEKTVEKIAEFFDSMYVILESSLHECNTIRYNMLDYFSEFLIQFLDAYSQVKFNNDYVKKNKDCEISNTIDVANLHFLRCRKQESKGEDLEKNRIDDSLDQLIYRILNYYYKDTENPRMYSSIKFDHVQQLVILMNVLHIELFYEKCSDLVIDVNDWIIDRISTLNSQKEIDEYIKLYLRYSPSIYEFMVNKFKKDNLKLSTEVVEWLKGSSINQSLSYCWLGYHYYLYGNREEKKNGIELLENAFKWNNSTATMKIVELQESNDKCCRYIKSRQCQGNADYLLMKACNQNNYRALIKYLMKGYFPGIYDALDKDFDYIKVLSEFGNPLYIKWLRKIYTEGTFLENGEHSFNRINFEEYEKTDKLYKKQEKLHNIKGDDDLEKYRVY